MVIALATLAFAQEEGFVLEEGKEGAVPVEEPAFCEVESRGCVALILNLASDGQADKATPTVGDIVEGFDDLGCDTYEAHVQKHETPEMALKRINTAKEPFLGRVEKGVDAAYVYVFAHGTTCDSDPSPDPDLEFTWDECGAWHTDAVSADSQGNNTAFQGRAELIQEFYDAKFENTCHSLLIDESCFSTCSVIGGAAVEKTQKVTCGKGAFPVDTSGAQICWTRGSEESNAYVSGAYGFSACARDAVKKRTVLVDALEDGAGTGFLDAHALQALKEGGSWGHRYADGGRKNCAYSSFR